MHSRAIHVLVAVLTVALCSTAALARELRGELSVDTIWTDNVFSADEDGDEVSDTSFRITPSVEATEPDGDVTWELSYAPSYEYSTDISGLRGFDHDLDGSITWRITPKTSVHVFERFERFRSIARRNEVTTAPGGADSVEFFGTRNRFIRNFAGASLAHNFTARHRTTASFQLLSWEFSEDNQSDVTIGIASLAHSYALAKRTRLTANAIWRNRENDGIRNQGKTESDFYSLTGSIDHTFDTTFSLNISAGPTYVTSEQERVVPTSRVSRFPVLRAADSAFEFLVDPATCPRLDDGTPFFGSGCAPLGGIPITPDVVNPTITVQPVGAIPAADTSNVSFFAHIGIVKEWDQWKLELDVERRADDSSSVGAASVEDIASVRLRYRPTRRLTLSLLGSYSIREQETEFLSYLLALQPSATPVCFSNSPGGCLLPVSGQAEAVELRPTLIGRGDERKTSRINFHARYRWSEQLSVKAIANWYSQEDEFGGRVAFDRERLTFWLGFDYAFEPYPF